MDWLAQADISGGLVREISALRLLLGTITGGLFAGVGGAALGGIVGYHEGQSSDDSVNQMVASGIVSFLLNRRYSWHAQT